MKSNNCEPTKISLIGFLNQTKKNIHQLLHFSGNIDSERDWGHARDYVRGMWMMLQVEKPEDFVLATGEKHSVREFCEKAFEYVGIELEWKGEGGSVNEIGVVKGNPEKVLIKIDPQYFRPTEVDLLIGDPSKAKRVLGWEPEITFEKLVHEMIDEEFKLLDSGDFIN